MSIRYNGYMATTTTTTTTTVTISLLTVPLLAADFLTQHWNPVILETPEATTTTTS